MDLLLLLPFPNPQEERLLRGRRSPSLSDGTVAMVINNHTHKKMAAKTVNIITPSDDLPPQKLKELVLVELKAPAVFKGFIGEKWADALTWSPLVMSEKLSDVCTRFKVCPKVGTLQHREILSTTDVVYETHCEYVDASFSDFNKWLQTEIEDDETVLPPPQKIIKSNDKNPFSSVPRSIYWIYADYKYMNELCSDHLDIIDAVDWSVFGFDTRNGLSSTLWIGSEGASTPCHYDTYGCNLVAQLWGTKEWILFSPDDHHKLYPTRVPFEESSVFSRVNIKSPQINKYCDFLKATPYKVRYYTLMIIPILLIYR